MLLLADDQPRHRAVVYDTDSVGAKAERHSRACFTRPARACATVMFGRRPDGTEVPPPMDLVRLAIPRRVYIQSHIDYAAEAVIHVASQKDRPRGFPRPCHPEG